MSETTMVHILHYGEYEDRTIVDVFTSRALAEARIVKDVLDGIKIQGCTITACEVVTTNCSEGSP